MEFHTHRLIPATKEEAEAGLRDDVALSPASLFGAVLPIANGAVAGGGAPIYDTKVGMTAVTVPDGTNAIRLNGYYAAGDGGGALYKKVGSQPTHAGKVQSADGAWWELAENIVTLEMFGGVADGAISGSSITGTDNLAAMNAALLYGKANLGGAAGAYGVSATIQLLRGRYRFTNTIKINHQVRIIGAAGAGMGNAEMGSHLLFPQNTTGFFLLGYQTPDPDTGVPSAVDCSGTILEYFRVQAVVGSTDKTRHGIVMKSRVILNHLQVFSFGGNGIDINAIAGVSGNANNFQIIGCRCIGNENGIYVDGPDANAGLGDLCDGSSNRGWGIFDGSFLGNTWVGCHCDANGLNAGVHYGTNRYSCRNPALGGTTTPGTNPAVWYDQGAGSVHSQYPEWIPGHGYVTGGAYYCEGVNARSVFLGCYAEGGQPPNEIYSPSVVVGGSMGGAGLGNALDIFKGGSARGFTAGQEYLFGTTGTVATLANGDDGLVVMARSDHDVGLAMARWDEATGSYGVQWANAGTPMRYTAQDCTFTFGRSATVGGGQIVFPQGVWVGQSTGNARQITNAATIPTTGTWAQGDIVFNINATAGVVGWVCTAGGTPGTWSPFGGAGSSGAATHVADTPPSSPVDGQLWWESDSGLLFIWYNDGTSSQWVEAAAGPAGGGEDDVIGGIITIASTAPSSPAIGDVWIDTT